MDGGERIPPEQALAALRGILVSSLSRENLSPSDEAKRRKVVTFGSAEKKAGVVPVDSGAPQPPARQHQPQGSPSAAVPLKSPTTATSPPGSRPTSHKGGSQTIHWFACVGGNSEINNSEVSARNWSAGSGHGLEDSGGGESNIEPFDSNSLGDSGKENAAGLAGLSQKDREERLRTLRERQNEERQKKLEELKQQALAAQKFREQKEEERRRRIEQLRERDEGRRLQVEERKRQIWEAERDRREAILRKNQEREARIEAKRKNERSSIVFAFGSSTPRMLEPADTGGSFWGSRRATSTTNVMFSSMVGSTGSSGGGDKGALGSGLSVSPGGVPTTSSTSLSRRSSERELIGGVMSASMPAGSKKRAVSAHALDRKAGDDEGDGSSRMSTFNPYGPSPRARKKTDLMPTIPSPRGSGGDGLHQKGRHKSPGVARSGDATPSSPSRPLSALSVHSSSGSGVSFRHRPHLSLSPASHATPLASPTSAPYSRKPRPISIAITGVSHDSAVSPVGSREIRSASKTSSDNKSRPHSAADKEVGAKPPKVPSAKKATPKTEGVTHARKSAAAAGEKMQSAKSATKSSPKASPIHSPAEPAQQGTITEPEEEAKEKVVKEAEVKSEMETSTDGMEKQDEMKPVEGDADEGYVNGDKDTKADEKADSEAKEEKVEEKEEVVYKGNQESSQDVDMTASMIARTRITNEMEAKAALAERRRLAREQAEREAELERLRLEEEARLEEERLRKEEEEQRRAEAEQLRLIEEASRLEEQRLQQAIEEAQRREREEALRREEEAKARAEKEEQDKKAREEAERQRQEMEERLKKEEEDRQMRRKRVEAIMLRTRAKAATPTSTPTKGGKEKEDSPSEERKDAGEQQPTQTADEGSEKMVLEGAGDRQETTTGGSSSSSSEPTTTEGSPSNQGASPGHPIVSSTRNDADNSVGGTNLLISDNVVDPLQAMLNNNGTEISRPKLQTNGHRNGMDFGPQYANVDDVKLNNTANNLLDLSEFDVHLQQTQQLPLGSGGSNAFSYSKQLSHEDNVNSNAHAPPSSMGGPHQPSIPTAPLQTVTGELDTIIPTGSPLQVEDSISSAKRQDKNAPLVDLMS